MRLGILRIALVPLVLVCSALLQACSFAAVDVNKANAAELDSVKGIGPGISTKILDERKKGNFKDWTDFVERVKGVGEGNAAKFSSEGLTVNGAAFKGVAAAPSAKKDDKPAVKAEEKKADAKPIAAAPAAATPAAKDEKNDAKAAKAAEKKAKADEAKAKNDMKADAAKPAASAAKK